MPADRSWGARLAEYLLSRARTPELHEMDGAQLAIFRMGYAAGREASRVPRPTAAEARMHLIEALEEEARRLRALAAKQQAEIAERAEWLPAKGAL